MAATDLQYDQVIQGCKDIFIKKAKDYGTAWRVLRTISIVDQIFIKAQRIRTIQEKGSQKIGDDISSEFRGIINYAVIGSIQLELPAGAPEELPVDKIEQLYESHTNIAKKLMQDKKHEPGKFYRPDINEIAKDQANFNE